MSRLLPVAGVALALLPSGLASPAAIPVSGGTPAQQRLLTDIAARLTGRASIRRIRIEPAHRTQWPAGSVALVAEGTSRHGLWQAQVLAASFQARSIIQGLPPVVAIRWNGGETNLWGPRGWKPRNVDPIVVSPGAARAVQRRLESAAASVHVQGHVQLASPYGLVAEVTLRAADPASFLHGRRLCLFKRRAKLRALHGYYLVVRGTRTAALELSAQGVGASISGSWARRGSPSPCLIPLSSPG